MTRRAALSHQIPYHNRKILFCSKNTKQRAGSSGGKLHQNCDEKHENLCLFAGALSALSTHSRFVGSAAAGGRAAGRCSFHSFIQSINVEFNLFFYKAFFTLLTSTCELPSNCIAALSHISSSSLADMSSFDLKTTLDECGQSHVYELTKCFEGGPDHPVLAQVTYHLLFPSQYLFFPT